MTDESRAWRIAPLTKAHVRDAFACGEPELDEFLRRYARQNQERGIARTFVATRAGQVRVLGYFSLAAGSVEFETLPQEDRRRLPAYPVPVVLLARLAVDGSVQGRGLGAVLLVDALRRALRASEIVGAVAVEVVAKGDAARRFYAHFGFSSLEDDLLHMFLPMRAARASLDAGGAEATR